MKKNKVTIHIGSSNPANNEGLSGISIAIGHNSDITVHSMVVPETSANRLAIRAITESLKLLNGPSNVTVYSDSQYAIYGASGRNKRKMNLDLWKELDKAAKPHNLTFQWMPQHKDDWIKHCKVTARMTAKAGTKPPKNLGSYWASQTGGLGSNCHSFQAISSKIMSPFLRYTRKEIRVGLDRRASRNP